MKTNVLLLIILFFSCSVFAQTGRISGSVIDENNLSLIGANVFIESLGVGAATNNDGDYRILNIAPGTYTLNVSFLGYQSKSQEITVEANRTTEANFQLESGVVLGEEVLVLGDQLKGQAKALNQQRNNMNITNVVSSDQIGRFPDANIGDALKRIPSISVYYDQGEARFANIRGTEPRLNSITVNGERIPSAEGEIRAIQLDLVPSDMIQTIEVNKAVTPDMDADAIGGSVNLVTKSAPNKLRLSGTLAGNYNFLSESAAPIGSFTVGNRFMEGKLGAVLSGSYYDHELGSDNTEGEWDGDPGNYFPKEWQIREYQLRRLRQSIGLNLDYKFNSFNTIYLRGIFNHRNDWENRYRAVYEMDTDEDDNGNEIDIWKVERQTKGGIGSDKNDNRRLEDQKMWTTSLAGEHLFGTGMKLNWSASLSKASEERPNERYVQWATEVPASDVTIGVSNPEEPSITQNIPLSAFELDELTEEHQFTEETDFNSRIDLQIPLVTSGKYENSIKFGGRYRSKEKERDNDFFEYTPINEPASFLDWDNADYSNPDFLAGDYSIGNFTTEDFLGSLDLDNPNLFEKEDKPDEYAADNYNAEEKVMAGYAMLNQKIGDKLELIAGVRIEKTDIDYTGNEVNIYENNEGDEVIDVTSISGTDDYTNFLPGLHLKYSLNQNSLLRFAWTNTIARPNYYDLVPYRAIEETDEIAVGNPTLEPTTSMNFDLMAENYFKSVGLVSAGLFYKSIDDFIYVYSEEDYSDPVSGNTFDEFFQPRNGASATLFGFEIAFQRRLDFISPIFRNLSIYTNYTYTNSSADNPVLDAQVEGDEDIELPGTSPHTFNANLTYQDQKLVLGVSFNFTAAYLDPDELDITPGLERYYDDATYLDINGAYAFTPNIRFFFEANNLLNTPLRFYAGDKDRTFQQEFYNARINAGVKFDF